MAITGFVTDIPSPLLARRGRGLLVDAVVPITQSDAKVVQTDAFRPEAGVRFCQHGAHVLTAWEDDSCVEVTVTETDPDTSTPPTFSSFTISADENAPERFPEEWVTDRLANRQSVMYSANLASELETGAVTGNSALIDSVTHAVDANTAVDEVLFVIDEIVKDFSDTAFTIHCTPGALTLLTEHYDLLWDGMCYRTPTGHAVVGDAGYDCTQDINDPAGGADLTVAATGQWVFATLPVHAWVGPERMLGTPEGRIVQSENRRYNFLVRDAVVAFDPSVVVAVEMTVPSYTVAVVP